MTPNWSRVKIYMTRGHILETPLLCVVQFVFLINVKWLSVYIRPNDLYYFHSLLKSPLSFYFHFRKLLGLLVRSGIYDVGYPCLQFYISTYVKSSSSSTLHSRLTCVCDILCNAAGSPDLAQISNSLHTHSIFSLTPSVMFPSYSMNILSSNGVACVSRWKFLTNVDV